MDDRDVLLTLILDYGSILSPQAIQIYLCYWLLKDEHDIADVTYANLMEHFGIATSTIAGVNDSLKTAGLIDIIEKENFGKLDEVYEATRRQLIKILPIKPLSTEGRKEAFKKAGIVVDSSIRERALSLQKLSPEYSFLFSKKDLQIAFDKLGKDRFAVSGLVEVFKLDKEKVKLLLSNRILKGQLIKLMKEIATVSLDCEEVKEELSKIIKKNKRKSYNELYEVIKTINLIEGREIPISEWGPAQLLRYFCILYEQYNGQKYTIMFNTRSKGIGCRELGELKSILLAFESNVNEVVKYMDWLFKEKNKILKNGVLSTAILKSTGMINEYKKKAAGPITYKDTDPIENGLISWVKANVSSIFKLYDLKCMKDLYWLKEAYNRNECDEDVRKVVEEGIKRKILPQQGNLVFKRG